MKHKDYRIGNWVEFDNRVFEIHTLAEEFPTLNTIEFGIGVVDWNNIKPILLTDEWLIKLGFTKTKGRYGYDYYLAREYEVYFILEHWVDVYENSKWKNHWHIKYTIKPFEIKYIHQLQNLFWALTGEELTIKNEI